MSFKNQSATAKYFRTVILLLLCLMNASPHADDATPSASECNLALQRLAASSMQDREAAVRHLATFKEPKVLAVLTALSEGRLYKLRDSETLVIKGGVDGKDVYTDAITQAATEIAEEVSPQKLAINNSVRTALKKILGQLQLANEDAAVRLAAVKAIGKKLDEETAKLLQDRLVLEKDTGVQSQIKAVLALQQLQGTDKSLRLAAIELLQEHPTQDVVNALNAQVEKDGEGNFVETDNDVRNKAKSALAKINAKIGFYDGVETLFFGLSLGAVLVLSAIGLAITFGVMGVINMAHGELMMLGAYTTYVMQQIMPNNLGLAVLLSIPAAFVISALTGIAIERGIIRFLYGRPLETLLATFGVSLVLQQSVRSIFSPLNRSVSTPEFMSGTLQINDFLALTWNRFYILLFCLLVFTLLLQVLQRTRLGLEVRAVAQNRNMAKAMGIPTAWVDAMTFGLGSGIAGVAGVALSQITNVGPNLGQAYIVDSFMVVVFGGVGNLWGTLLAGFSLGIANKLLEPSAGAVLAKILVLVFIILFIQKRPRGLFPQKGRAAEV
jgi:urea transport system permease protein